METNGPRNVRRPVEQPTFVRVRNTDHLRTPGGSCCYYDPQPILFPHRRKQGGLAGPAKYNCPPRPAVCGPRGYYKSNVLRRNDTAALPKGFPPPATGPDRKPYSPLSNHLPNVCNDKRD